MQANPTPTPLSAEDQRALDARAGKRLLIGLLVLFFGMAFTANGIIVWQGTHNAAQIVPSYETEAR